MHEDCIQIHILPASGMILPTVSHLIHFLDDVARNSPWTPSETLDVDTKVFLTAIFQTLVGHVGRRPRRFAAPRGRG